jgi:hypothetical protein
MSVFDNHASEIAKIFSEIVIESEIKFDEIYLHYREDSSRYGGTESYVISNELNFIRFNEGAKDTIRTDIWKIICELFNIIEKDKGVRPKVFVLKVNDNYDFEVKLNYDDPDALSIRIKDLGSKLSYFYGRNIN